MIKSLQIEVLKELIENKELYAMALEHEMNTYREGQDLITAYDVEKAWLQVVHLKEDLAKLEG